MTLTQAHSSDVKFDEISYHTTISTGDSGFSCSIPYFDMTTLVTVYLINIRHYTSLKYGS